MWREPPVVAPGAPANLVVLNFDELLNNVRVERTCVDGRWFEPEQA
jgi:hypothetical protein